MRPVILFVAALLLAAPVFALTNIAACTNLDSDNEIYNLTASVSCAGSCTCMNVSADNVTLQCNGFTISGPGAFTISYGVNITGGDNSTVLNCTVRDFAYGISIDNTDFNNITNNTLTADNRGIHLTSSLNSTLEGNVIYSNFEVGVEINGNSAFNLLKNNTINLQTSGTGVFIGALDNNLTGNIMTANRQAVFVVAPSCRNYIDRSNLAGYAGDPIFYLYDTSGVTISDNSSYGELLVCDVNNSIIRNITMTDDDGIILSGSHFNTIYNNSITGGRVGGRACNGFELTNSNNNTLLNNTASNDWFGFDLQGASNSTLYNNNGSSNAGGLSLATASYNRVSNSTLDSNDLFAIQLFIASPNNLFQNVSGSAGNTGFSHGLNILGYGTSTNNSFTDCAFGAGTDPAYITLYVDSNANTFTNFSLASANNEFITSSGAINSTFTNLTLTKDGTLVNFPATFNLTNSSNSSNTNISTDFVSMDSSSVPELNQSANITTYIGMCPGVRVFTAPGFPSSRSAIVSGGVQCATCSILSCAANTVRFSVPGFTGFAPGTNCPVINASGSYEMTENFTGAPNVAPPYFGGGACVVISANDVAFDCNGSSITNNGTVGGNTAGVFVNYSSNVTVKNCPAVSGYTHGISAYYSNYTVFTNDTVFNNTFYGLDSNYGYYDNITFNRVYNLTTAGIHTTSEVYGLIAGNLVNTSLTHGIFIEGGENSSITNNTAYNNSNCGLQFKGGILNNATNNTLYLNLDGFCVTSGPEGSFVANNSAYNNTEDGFTLTDVVSSNNLFQNNTARYNGRDGFHLADFSRNVFTLNLAENNSAAGFNITGGSDANNLTYNVVVGNRDGIHIEFSENNSLANDTSHGNSAYGMLVSASNTTTVYNTHLYNNGLDLIASGSGIGGEGIRLYNLVFDNPLGNFANFTNLSVATVFGGEQTFTVNWTTNESALPTDYLSFRQKFVNITNLSVYGISFDNITWHWTDAELAGYNESRFELWKYNSSGWSNVSTAVLDVAANQISVLALNPASDFGILQNNASENCPVITTPGTAYVQPNNFVGAPNDASPVLGSACVKIAASDVVFDCNGFNITDNGTAGSTFGVLLNGSLTNVTVRNCPGISNYTYGINVYRSNNSLFTNNTAYGNADGFYLETAYNVTFSDNLAANNTVVGFYLTDSANNNTFTGNTAFNSSLDGFLLVLDSYYNNLSNNTAYGNANNGFHFSTAHNSTLANNVAHHNAQHGFLAEFSDYTSFTGDRAYNNTLDGFFADDSSYANFSAALSYDNTQYGFALRRSNHSTLAGCLANRDYDAFYLETSFFANATGNTAADSAGSGVYLTDGAGSNNFTSNLVYNNSINGFYLVLDSASNLFVNNSVFNNTDHGFAITASNSNALIGNTVYGNTAAGTYVEDSNLTSISRDRYYRNNPDLKVNFTIFVVYPDVLNVSTVIFDNPFGTLENFTNLSVNDTIGASMSYSVNWTANESALPDGKMSFAQKFVNISTLGGTVALDSAVLHWTDAEVTAGGYNKSDFSLWKYNASGWTMENGTPDTTGNTLSLANLNPQSDYGILQNASVNCPVINSSGVYVQTIHYVGAPNNASPLTDWACVKIAASDVVFDCNGFNITNNGTGGTTYGILLNGSLTNVTVRNCPAVSQYTYGIYVNGSNDSILANNTVFSTPTGFAVQSSNRINLTDNLARDNTVTGFYIASSTGGALTGNNATNNPFAGFYLTKADNLTAYNDIANGSAYGFYLDNANYNDLANNTAFGSSFASFYLFFSNLNNFTNDTAYLSTTGFFVQSSNNVSIASSLSRDNALDGYYLVSSLSGILSGNNASNNSRSGIHLSKADRHTITNNTADGSTYDFYLEDTNNFNVLAGNNASGTTQFGFYLNSSSNNNLLANNTASGAPFAGYYLLFSDLNNLTNNTAYLSTTGFFIQSSDLVRLTDNVANGNVLDGLFVVSSISGALSGNNASNNPRSGIHLSKADNHTLTNNLAEGSTYGFYLEDTNNFNTLAGNTGRNDSFGFYLNSSSNDNNLSGNLARDNAIYGIALYQSLRNNLVSNNATNNSINGIFLGWSNFNNLTLNRGSANGQVGIYLLSSNNSVLSANNATDNGIDGFYLTLSAYNVLVNNNSAVNNSFAGFFLNQSSDNALSGNEAHTAGFFGFYVYDASSRNNLTSNTAHGLNAGFGVSNASMNNRLNNNVAYANIVGIGVVNSANGNNLTNNTAHGNFLVGVGVMSADNTRVTGGHYYNNSPDFLLGEGLGLPEAVILSNVIVDNPLGNLLNFTNLSITDVMTSETYLINWTANESALPVGYISFRQKFVNITVVSGAVSIDTAVWHWTDAELAGYTESRFGLWKYNSSGWAVTPATLSTAANTLTLLNFVPESDYGILENTTVPTPPSGGGGPSTPSISASLSSTTCNGSVVTVRSGGSPLSGADVIIDDRSTGFTIFRGTTNSSGQVSFTGCGMSVRIRADKAGYSPDTITSTLVDCASCAVTPPPACMADTDCAANYTCVAGTCVPMTPPPPPPPECTSDADCSGASRCSGGSCIAITGCGVVTNHTLVPYECGSEPGCPACPPDKLCVDHVCVVYNLTGRDDFVGNTTTLHATEGTVPCARCSVLIFLPNGRNITGLTDENGSLRLPLTIQGSYRVELLKNGVAVTYVIIHALPIPSPGEVTPPTTILDQIVASLWWLLLLLAIIILIIIYLRRRRKKAGRFGQTGRFSPQRP